MKLFISVTAILIFATSLLAQKKSVTVEASFPTSPGVTVDKLPTPAYPQLANAAGLDGNISVTLTLDEKGKVIATDNAEGPYPVCPLVTDPKVSALRYAALTAASKAKFKMPTQTTGNTKGRITYTFVSDHKTTESGGQTVGARVVENPNDSDTGIRLDRITKLGTVEDKAPNNSSPSASQEKAPATYGLDPNAKPVFDGAEPVNKRIQNPDTVSGGVLNGKAMELKKPTYPAAAKAVRAGGSVSVQVLIDEQGNMYSAASISGHPLLRRNAEIAACGSRFSPTLLEGHPVKVSGIITYNFIP